MYNYVNKSKPEGVVSKLLNFMYQATKEIKEIIVHEKRFMMN